MVLQLTRKSSKVYEHVQIKGRYIFHLHLNSQQNVNVKSQGTSENKVMQEVSLQTEAWIQGEGHGGHRVGGLRGPGKKIEQDQ